MAPSFSLNNQKGMRNSSFSPTVKANHFPFSPNSLDFSLAKDAFGLYFLGPNFRLRPPSRRNLAYSRLSCFRNSFFSAHECVIKAPQQGHFMLSFIVSIFYRQPFIPVINPSLPSMLFRASITVE
jgi:hypothetical protein